MHAFGATNLLILFSLVTSFKMYAGNPIECIVPKGFSESEEQYAENYCWSQDTYFLPFDEQVPKDLSEREDRQISYYQWVPFFLLIEAACFRLPSLVWKYLAGHSGIKIHDIVKLALDEKNVDPEMRKSNIHSLTVHLQNALRFHRRLEKKKSQPHRFALPLNLPYTAVFVTTMYLVTKVLYLINVILQLWLLNKFLETDKYSMYGWGAMKDIINGTQWEHTGVFPRVTLCDFQVRVMGNIQRYSVQCVLVINIFNEKIFIFLWFWYIILLGLTIASLLYWLFISLLPFCGRWFIVRHLELGRDPFDAKASDKDVERFVSRYLRKDGVFILRMITMHAGIIFATDLVVSLWNSFFGIEQKYKRTESQMYPGREISNKTPTSGGILTNDNEDNRLAFLRNRKSKSKGTDEDNEKGEDKSAASDSEESEDLTRQLIAPSAPNTTLNYPDSKSTTLEAGRLNLNLPNNRTPNSYLSSSPRNKGSKSLKISIPGTDRSDYRTARDRSPRTPGSNVNRPNHINQMTSI